MAVRAKHKVQSCGICDLLLGVRTALGLHDHVDSLNRDSNPIDPPRGSPASPGHQRCGSDERIGHGFLQHPAAHRAIGDGHPGVRRTRPIRRGDGGLVASARVESASDEGPSELREHATAHRIDHRALFPCPATHGTRHP